jgi:hypothetical protein
MIEKKKYILWKNLSYETDLAKKEKRHAHGNEEYSPNKMCGILLVPIIEESI